VRCEGRAWADVPASNQHAVTVLKNAWLQKPLVVRDAPMYTDLDVAAVGLPALGLADLLGVLAGSSQFGDRKNVAWNFWSKNGVCSMEHAIIAKL
jgi:hypothetical protein